MEFADQGRPSPGSVTSFDDSIPRTPYPCVTGKSAVAIKYKDGILMAADMGGSYGSTQRYKSVERMKPLGKHSLLGGSGEISDFQEILLYLDELIINDNMWDDGNSLGPKEIAKLTEEGVTTFQHYSLKTYLGFSAFHNPTVGANGSW